jgi:hypothetical protein
VLLTLYIQVLPLSRDRPYHDFFIILFVGSSFLNFFVHPRFHVAFPPFLNKRVFNLVLLTLYIQVSPLSRDMERLRVSSPAARKVPVDPKAAAANRKRRSSKQGDIYII